MCIFLISYNKNKTMPFEWSGVMPALTTKFTADDKLDLPLFEKNLKKGRDRWLQ